MTATKNEEIRDPRVKTLRVLPTPIKMSGKAKDIGDAEWARTVQDWPRKLLAQNTKMKRSKFWQWSIPALYAEVPNLGDHTKLEKITTCPTAGECRAFCYAQQGMYRFKGTAIAHTRNLHAYRTNPDQLQTELTVEIMRKFARRSINAVRIHDSGDFFNRAYLDWWCGVARTMPDITFYAYTKRVKMLKRAMSEDTWPKNLQIVFSMGGTEDHLIDVEKDRHSRVFNSMDELVAAGYHDSSYLDEAAPNPKISKIGFVYHGAKNVTV